MEFPALYDLMGGYFHQDWWSYGTEDDVIDQFMIDQVSLHNELASEVHAVLSLDLTEAQLERMLEDFGAQYDPTRLHDSTRAWLEHILQRAIGFRGRDTQPVATPNHERTPALGVLMGAYFHQDWAYDADEDATLRLYLAGDPDSRRLPQEIEWVLAALCTEGEVKQHILDLGSCHVPGADDGGCRGWLMSIAARARDFHRGNAER